MPARSWLAAAALVLTLALAGGAQAATSIFYSAPENSYGWCAGFAVDQANSCARGNCVKFGGTACRLVLTCTGGWGAVALAEDPWRAVGASCGFGNAFWARTAALASCTAEARTLCWSDTIFDANAREQPRAGLRLGDLVWYAQAILQLGKYDDTPTDGVLGPKTRAGLQKVQADLGRPATGQLDEDLLLRMIDAVEGPQYLAKTARRVVVEGRSNDIADRAYGFSPSPAPARSFSDELAERPPAAQRLALAAMLSLAKSKCTLPAEDAVRQTGDTWFVACAEGTYLFTFSEGSRLVVNAGRPVKADKDR